MWRENNMDCLPNKGSLYEHKPMLNNCQQLYYLEKLCTDRKRQIYDSESKLYYYILWWLKIWFVTAWEVSWKTLAEQHKTMDHCNM